MKKLIFIWALLAFHQVISGQQLPLFDQYLYNKFLINPAQAGSDGYTSFNLTTREQWVGYSGAPRTFAVSGQYRIMKKSFHLKRTIFNNVTFSSATAGRVGLGGYIFSDRNGLIKRTGFQGAYSYHLWLQPYTQLSMGIALTGYHFIINADEHNFQDPSEPWLNNNLRRGVFIPDADFGIYLINPRFDAGFSALQLFGATLKLGDYAYRHFNIDRHFYLFGSYTFNAEYKTNLMTSFLFKISEQIRPQADLGITYIIRQKIWAGLTWRTNEGIIANIRFRYLPSNSINSAMFLGYAFDFSTNQMQRATYGTHEITIALRFGDSRRRYRWLDRY